MTLDTVFRCRCKCEPKPKRVGHGTQRYCPACCTRTKGALLLEWADERILPLAITLLALSLLVREAARAIRD